MKRLSSSLGLLNGMLTVLLLPLGLIFLGNDFANSQVTSDHSLNTSVSQNGNHFTITNGSAAGTNLFHSFNQFSVPQSGSATFDLINTPNISTIFSRVTGGSISSINGLIQIIHHQNSVSLFLLNPNGIVFGADASLNIGGSFIGTTANRIKFRDGVDFSAGNVSDTPLLSISVPIGLQWVVIPVQLVSTTLDIV